MLAFLDSPVQLAIAAIVILIVFGPQKLPEIAGQLGRALRELKRTTSELQDTLNLDHHTDHNNYQDSYNPPSYDSYGNPTTAIETQTASVPENDMLHSAHSDDYGTRAIMSGTEPVRGDFAASALSDAGSEYGMGLNAPDVSHHSGATAYVTPANNAGAVTAETSATDTFYPRPAEGSVARPS